MERGDHRRLKQPVPRRFLEAIDSNSLPNAVQRTDGVGRRLISNRQPVNFAGDCQPNMALSVWDGVSGHAR